MVLGGLFLGVALLYQPAADLFVVREVRADRGPVSPIRRTGKAGPQRADIGVKLLGSVIYRSESVSPLLWSALSTITK